MGMSEKEENMTEMVDMWKHTDASNIVATIEEIEDTGEVEEKECRSVKEMVARLMATGEIVQALRVGRGVYHGEEDTVLEAMEAAAKAPQYLSRSEMRGMEEKLEIYKQKIKRVTMEDAERANLEERIKTLKQRVRDKRLKLEEQLLLEELNFKGVENDD